MIWCTRSGVFAASTVALATIVVGSPFCCSAQSVGAVQGNHGTPVGPGTVSTQDYESGATLAPGGRWLFFAKRLPVEYLWVICVSELVDGAWATPRVAGFSGTHSDRDPFISPDGNHLFFASDRPRGTDPLRRDFDIWVVDRTPTGWGEPRWIEGLSTNREELHPTVDRHGTLYFASDRLGSRQIDIYRALLESGTYRDPKVLESPISSDGVDGDPAISPNGDVIVFVSIGRTDEPVPSRHAYARGDLYAAAQTAGGWSQPRRLPDGINTAAAELAPAFSPDGARLFFASERGFATLPRDRPLTYRELRSGIDSVTSGLGNIYEIDAREALGDVPTAVAAQMVGTGTVSTDMNEFGGALSLDGEELYLSLSVPRSYAYVLCVSRLKNGRWTKPEVLPFSGMAKDFDPVLSPDREQMFFASDRDESGRSAEKPDVDIWVASNAQ